MLQSAGHEDHAALCKNVPLIAQPQFDLAAQIARIFRVRSYESQYLVEVVRVRGRRIFARLPAPVALRVGAPGRTVSSR